jgi:hypothetical protein
LNYLTKVKRMHAMGFEPMRVAPVDLESTALDRSATHALDNLTNQSCQLKPLFTMLIHII